MTRPRLEIVRPAKMRIADGIVECRYKRGQCFYRSGPYLDRDEAAETARAHWLGVHARSGEMALAA